MLRSRKPESHAQLLQTPATRRAFSFGLRAGKPIDIDQSALRAVRYFSNPSVMRWRALTAQVSGFMLRSAGKRVSQHVAGLAVVALQNAMPLQNRVSPFGELFATCARGTLMGNRGGRLHDHDRKLTARRWTSRAWICCRLEFNNRHRSVWGDGYTELFFLDEVTGFAAGHRPCFECRRKDAQRFATLFAAGATISVHSRASGNPALGPRLREDERIDGRASAKAMDDVLHAERVDGKAKRVHRRKLDVLPDGAMIALNGEAFAVRGTALLRWTFDGYADTRSRPSDVEIDVLTPPSILAVLRRGYGPLWHPTAQR